MGLKHPKVPKTVVQVPLQTPTRQSSMVTVAGDTDTADALNRINEAATKAAIEALVETAKKEGMIVSFKVEINISQ